MSWKEDKIRCIGFSKDKQRHRPMKWEKNTKVPMQESHTIPSTILQQLQLKTFNRLNRRDSNKLKVPLSQ